MNAPRDPMFTCHGIMTITALLVILVCVLIAGGSL